MNHTIIVMSLYTISYVPLYGEGGKIPLPKKILIFFFCNADTNSDSGFQSEATDTNTEKSDSDIFKCKLQKALSYK